MPALLLFLIAIVVLAVVGISALGLGLKILWWALIGLVIGGLGRAVIPGAQNLSLQVTILGGVAAALLGGVIARALDVGNLLQFLIAVIVAGLMALYGPPLAKRLKQN